MDYKKFREDFQSSGKSQRVYGEENSISASMVYYLRKARESTIRKDEESSFRELKVVQEPLAKQIKIITADGLQILIPF
ncbi:MAG: hypothetical protein ACI86M_001485 [Saprospiraceae bacterium]|jgi:hypothetical protein